jgi:hypothetical protein
MDNPTTLPTLRLRRPLVTYPLIVSRPSIIFVELPRDSITLYRFTKFARLGLFSASIATAPVDT